MLSNRKMLMCANGACDFRVNQDSAYGGYCCKWCYVAHALELCPPQHGQMCERLPAPTGAIRAQPRPPDRQLSTNKKNIEKRNTRPASDLATASTAGVKATPPGNKRPELRMSKTWPDPVFSRVSNASRSEIQVPRFSQHTRVVQGRTWRKPRGPRSRSRHASPTCPRKTTKPEEEQKTHRINMAHWLKPPHPWILVYDFANRSPYYHNEETYESRWTLPTES